jgi:hypothetical protein
MVLIKNWKTKTNEELSQSLPSNNDGRRYVILAYDGVWYYTDRHYEPK